MGRPYYTAKLHGLADFYPGAAAAAVNLDKVENGGVLARVDALESGYARHREAIARVNAELAPANDWILHELEDRLRMASYAP